MKALHKYCVNVACLSEVRLADVGHLPIRVPGEDVSYHLYHSGVTDNSGLHGVAVALSPDAQDGVATDLTPTRVGSFEGSNNQCQCDCCLRAHSQSRRCGQGAVLRRLQAAVGGVPSSDVLIDAGDWNARTGPADDTTRHILGRHALGVRCDNDERLVSFADANCLIVTNIRLQHPPRHLVTWRSNDGRTA
ncbi:Hypothetical predicted protein [Octopus vulgaris]|uniref:Endonuclease/exonuclease/phosphatase domain-containing protein n=1 Tax=Octopus vulgaris TaxID=6645 RepID=A0AA36FI84_OCTVU|nr:Hypothetical predicted protein [Octopus vulgaris]